MALLFDTRTSDSPWIDSVWTCKSEQVAMMTSVATQTLGLVFWEDADGRHAVVTGPESRCGAAPVPEGAAFVGVQFAVGTSLRSVAAAALVDSGIVLPHERSRSFQLGGASWETPGPDDVEALVKRLIRHEVVVRDPLLARALRGVRLGVSDCTSEGRGGAIALDLPGQRTTS